MNTFSVDVKWVVVEMKFQHFRGIGKVHTKETCQLYLYVCKYVQQPQILIESVIR